MFFLPTSNLTRKRGMRVLMLRALVQIPAQLIFARARGELAQTVESVLDLPRDTGVFLGGVRVDDTNGLLSAGAEPGKWSFNSLLIIGTNLDDLIFDALPFGGPWYARPNAISNAVGYAQFYSRWHDAVIRVYDEAGNVIETHEHEGDFKDW
jgi:hypothetical protein